MAIEAEPVIDLYGLKGDRHSCFQTRTNQLVRRRFSVFLPCNLSAITAFDKAYTRDKETAATFSNTEGDFDDTLRSAIDSEVSRTIPDPKA
jgi:hypothetical protein